MKPTTEDALREVVDLLARGEVESFMVHLTRRDDSGAPASFRAVLQPPGESREIFTFLRTPQAAIRTVVQRWRDLDPEIDSLLE